MTGAFENNHNAMTMGVQEGGRVDDTGTPRGTTLDATPQAAVEPETLAVSSKRVRSLVRDNPTGPQEGVGYTGLSPKSPRSGRHGSKATTPGAVAVDGRILSVDQDSPGSIVGASGLSPKSVRKSRHGSKATTPGAVAVGNGDLVEANASKHLATAVTVTNTATLRQDSPSTVTTPGAVAVQGAADDSNMEESETTPGAVHETGGNPEHPKKLRSRLSRGPADEETTPGAIHETGGNPEHPKKLRSRLSRGPADEEPTPGAVHETGGSPEHPKKLRNRLSRGPADEEATPGAETSKQLTVKSCDYRADHGHYNQSNAHYGGDVEDPVFGSAEFNNYGQHDSEADEESGGSVDGRTVVSVQVSSVTSSQVVIPNAFPLQRPSGARPSRVEQGPTNAAVRPLDE